MDIKGPKGPKGINWDQNFHKWNRKGPKGPNKGPKIQCSPRKMSKKAQKAQKA